MKNILRFARRNEEYRSEGNSSFFILNSSFEKYD